MQLGRLIKSNNKVENRKTTFSYGWDLISKFMVWLEDNVNAQQKKLEKDYLLMKFGWNFKFYTSGQSHNLFTWIFTLHSFIFFLRCI